MRIREVSVRTLRRRRRTLSTFFSPAAHHRWTCLTTNRNCRSIRGKDLPDSISNGQRLTGMTSGQTNFPVASSIFNFKQHGDSGQWISDAMPHLSTVADDLCFVKSVHTEAINHDPAITFVQTGSQFPGRPSMGSWMSYGLGSENSDLPCIRCVYFHRDRPSGWSAAVRSTVGQRFFTVQSSRSETAGRRRSDLVPFGSPPALAAPLAAT